MSPHIPYRENKCFDTMADIVMSLADLVKQKIKIPCIQEPYVNGVKDGGIEVDI